MQKKSILLKNKERIYYLEEGKAKETLVLIHGNMSSSVHFLPLIDRLKDKFHIIAPDLRGFGDSSYNKGIDSLKDLTEDLIDLLNQLNISKYSLLGWSTGGAIALDLAAKKQESVKKLVLVESCSYRGYPIFKKGPLGQPLIGEYYSSKDEMALDMVQVKPMIDVLATNNIGFMKAIWDQVIYTVNKPSLADDNLYLSETMKQRNLLDIDWGLASFNMSNTTNGVSEGDNTIKDVKCPVLSFWGDTDLTVLEYMVDETVAALANAKKITLKSTGHSPFVDCPDEISNEIANFI